MRHSLWTLLTLCLFMPGLCWASYTDMAFPPAHEIFAPLQADPTELHFGFSWGVPVSHHDIVKIDAGDYLGLYRWAFPNDIGAAQLNIGGAIFSRFDATESHDLQVIDYSANVPLDVRLGPVSGRFMFYHDSSHLGDDYLRDKGIEDMNNSWNALKGLLSLQPWQALRIYGGYTDAIDTKPDWKGRQAVQGGVEIFFNTSKDSYLHPYWANDIQSWQRDNWNSTWVSQLGIKTGSENSKGRGISYFIQFMTGPRLEGQFYTNHETIWGAGLKFQLSEHLITPADAPEPEPASQTAQPTPATQ